MTEIVAPKTLAELLRDTSGEIRQVGTTWRLLFSILDDIDKHAAKTGVLVNDVELTGVHTRMCETVLMPRLVQLAELRGARVTHRLDRQLICIEWSDGRGVNVHVHPYDIRGREEYLRRHSKFAQNYHDHYWEPRHD